MLLDQRICIVTGAASRRGIGRGIAALFAEEGARVAIFDLSAESARNAADTLPGRGHRGYACDVTNPDQCTGAVAKVLAEFGRVDVLVNNAGIAQPNKILEIRRDNYDAVMDVNLRGTLQMCQAVIPAMQARSSGSIINVGSVAAQRGGGIFGGAHYSAAKGGIIALSKALARELGPDHIRVNVVCPSLVETDIHGDALSSERREQILASIPLGRIARPRDVAGPCLFLASDLSCFVTGAELDVNGGSHIH